MDDSQRDVLPGGPGAVDAGTAGSGRLVHGVLSGAAFGVRRGEGPLAWSFFVYFLILTTCHYAGKSVRQATYIDALGYEKLPWVYLAVALVSVPVLVLYTRLAARSRQQRLIVGTILMQATGLVCFYWLFGLGTWWAAPAFYVWMTLAFGIGVSQLWSYANHVFDPRQARRLFAFIGAGGLLGGIPGGQIARLVSASFGTRATLLAAALLMLGVLVLVEVIGRLERGLRGHGEERVRSAGLAAARSAQRLAEARGGLRAVRGSRLLRLIAVLMLLMVVVAQMVDLQFNWAIEQSTQVLDQRTEVYGNFFSLMGILAFIFQLAFTRRIHRVLGVGAGMRVLPATVGAGTVGLILATGGLVVPLFGAAWFLKLSEAGLRHSLDQATRELLFMPVPPRLRRQAKAYIDVFVQRFAKGVAAVLLLPVTFGVLSVLHVSWLTLVLVAIWIWVSIITRREYVRAFRQGLKPDAEAQPLTLDSGDLVTVTTLVESMGSLDGRTVVHSLDLLSAHGFGRLVPPLLLRHGDPLVRRRTLEVLGAEQRSDACPLIEAMLGDPDPEVRAVAIQTLASLEGGDARAMMLPRLTDPDMRLRSAAISCLMRCDDVEVVARARAVLAEMLSDAEGVVRGEAARTLGQIEEPIGWESLVQLLHDTDLAVVREAIAAVRRRLDRDGPNPIYVPRLIALMGNRRLKHDAREALVAHGESALDALVLFMRSPDEQTWVRRAVPKTVALLGGPRAAEALASGLGAKDAFLRRKIIEALAYLASHSGGHSQHSSQHSSRGLGLRAEMVRRELRAEAERYLRNMADLWAVSSMYEVRLDGPHARWRGGGRVPTLLQQLLAQRMAVSVSNIFGLLQLIHRPSDVRAAYRSLASGQPDLRARALEYLDNALAGAVRRDVFAVIDDAPPEEKLRQAGQLYGIHVASPEETLRRITLTDAAEVSGDPDTASLVLGALYSVHAERLTSFYPLVRTLAEQDEEPQLAEAAHWVLAEAGRSAGRERSPAGRGLHRQNVSRGHLPDRAAPVGPGAAGGPGAFMTSTSMAHIEMVVFLQGVDLLAYCNAEQVVRLAAIANEIRFEQGQVIYRRNEPPDALYCIVEGRVALAGDAGDAGDAAGRSQAGPRETFGVTDILSGQLRSCDATAVEPSRVLAIEAEDFFDLLSNNIEIVKALFRRLAHHGTGGPHQQTGVDQSPGTGDRHHGRGNGKE